MFAIKLRYYNEVMLDVPRVTLSGKENGAGGGGQAGAWGKLWRGWGGVGKQCLQPEASVNRLPPLLVAVDDNG